MPRLIHSFWASLVQRLKIANFYTEIWFLDKFENGEFYGGVRFFCFRPELCFLGKFGQKKIGQNCQFKLKFGTDSNMQNSMVMLTFSVLDLFGQIWSKI